MPQPSPHLLDALLEVGPPGVGEQVWVGRVRRGARSVAVRMEKAAVWPRSAKLRIKS
jgi:hypothetical protein